MEAFDKNQDPFDHLETYKTLMHLHDVPDEVMYKAFLSNLKGLARKWFRNLKMSIINSFVELSQSFMRHFIKRRWFKKPAIYIPTQCKVG